MNNSAFAGAEFVVTNDEDEAKKIIEIRKTDSSQNKTLAKDRTTLFVCTSGGSDKQSCIDKMEGRIESFQVDIPGAGIP